MKWKTEFKELLWEPHPDGQSGSWLLKCSACMEAVAKNLDPYNLSKSIWGTTGFNSSTKKACAYHWKSEFHKNCVERLGEQCAQGPDDGTLEAMEARRATLRSTRDIELKSSATKVIKGLKSVALLASENIPIAKYNSLVTRLGRAWDVEDINDEHYTNDIFAWEAVGSIAEHLTGNLRRELAVSPVYSLQFDGMTDNSNRSLLVVHVGYIKDGKPKLRFAQCGDGVVHWGGRRTCCSCCMPPFGDPNRSDYEFDHRWRRRYVWSSHWSERVAAKAAATHGMEPLSGTRF